MKHSSSEAGGMYSVLEEEGTAEEACVDESPRDALDERFLELDERVQEAVDGWFERVQHTLVTPLFETLQEVAVRHRQLLSALGTGDEGPAEARTDAAWARAAWERVRQYRRHLGEQVVHPLYAQLETLQIGDGLEQQYRRLLAEWARHAAEVPEHVEREEPGALYAPKPDESLGRRVRKASVRVRRRVGSLARIAGNMVRRVAGRPALQVVPAVQQVPLRQLATYHVHVRLPGVVHPVQIRLRQHLATQVAMLTARTTAYIHALLEAERLLDRATFHEPDLRFEQQALENAEGVPPGHVEAASPAPPATTREVQALAASFGAFLEALAASDGLEPLRAEANEAVVRAMPPFMQDVEQAGTFMLDLSERPVDPAAGRTLRRDDEQRQAWMTWHERVSARLALGEHLLTFREDTLRLEDAFVQLVFDTGVRPVLRMLVEADTSLRGLATSARQAFAEEQELARLRRKIHQLLTRALASVDQEVLTPLREERLPKNVRAAAESMVEERERILEALPVQLHVSLLPGSDEASIDPGAGRRLVPLQRLAEQAFDALLIERLRAALESVAGAVERVHTEAEGVPSILRFNLEAALEELAQVEAEGEQHLAAAQELVVGGLTRSADLLRELAQPLVATAPPFAATAHALFGDGFARLHQRLQVEERLKERVLDVRARLAEQVHMLFKHTGKQMHQGRVMARRTFRRSKSQAKDLIRRGQTAAGLATASETERRETIDALADIDALLERQPVVYRRLFSFRPVTDPTLLKGRQHDLDAVRKHYERWRRGLTNALVVTGYHGSGLTSFLNVLRQTVLKQADVRVMNLHTRVATEEDLAEQLNQVLALGLDAPVTLDDMARRLAEREPDAPPLVCCIEHLEHLFLRQVGGTDLLARVLMFISRADAHIFWVATVSDYGWQIVETAEPAAAGLVTQHTLAPLALGDIQAILENRHQRSGLPLRFESPAKGANPLVRRRLRRARTDEARQNVLRDDYFDRLYRTAGQNVMLALLYWLRSTEVSDDVMHVHAVEPLSFAFLQSFDLMRAFTLKALLEHTTLTVEEHSEVFQLPTDVSLQVFEALGNLLLIEPFNPEGQRARFEFSSVEQAVRYRIRPLLVHPIIQYLRGKNILH